MSGVVSFWCGGCPVWQMFSVMDVWCGQYPVSHKVRWMSSVVNVKFYTRCGVVNVCVADVVQSYLTNFIQRPLKEKSRVSCKLSTFQNQIYPQASILHIAWGSGFICKTFDTVLIDTCS